MRWLELVLENPEENFSAYIVLAIVLMNLIYLFGQIIRAFSGMFKSSQVTIATENSLQSRLIDEVAARSDFERRLLDLHENEVRTIKKDIVQILEEISQIRAILKAIFIQLKAKGYLK